MKKVQSVIIMTMKETGVSYLFGSLSAIYGMFSADAIGITYSALRNAVAKYIENNGIDESGDAAQLIYDTKRSIFTLHRAPLLIIDKKGLE